MAQVFRRRMSGRRVVVVAGPRAAAASVPVREAVAGGRVAPGPGVRRPAARPLVHLLLGLLLLLALVLAVALLVLLLPVPGLLLLLPVAALLRLLLLLALVLLVEVPLLEVVLGQVAAVQGGAGLGLLVLKLSHDPRSNLRHHNEMFTWCWMELGPGPGPPCSRPALNLAARLEESKEASLRRRSEAPFLGDPVCCGEFSADFLRLSMAVAMAVSRSNPMLISCSSSSGAEPSPELEAAFLPEQKISIVKLKFR